MTLEILGLSKSFTADFTGVLFPGVFSIERNELLFV